MAKEVFVKIRQEDLAALLDLLTSAGKAFDEIDNALRVVEESRYLARKQVRALRNWTIGICETIHEEK